jgi:hypothetical protein
VAVHVVDAFLRVVFLDKDRRVFLHAAVADDVDNAPNGEIVVGLFGDRVRRAGGVVADDPEEALRNMCPSPCSVSSMTRPGNRARTGNRKLADSC